MSYDRYSNDDYQALFEIDIEMDGGLAEILNRNGASHLTVCPVCCCDDFTHTEDCLLDER